MQIFSGTSGFSYAEWCGRFYPPGLPAAQMLRFYASRLPTVEINNTFYRMPDPATVAAWRAEVPESFRFSVKATRRITHQKRLVDAANDVAQLYSVIDVLGDKLGPVLFQLPPFLKKDLGVLEAFLSALPTGRPAAMEFRNASWFTDDVYAALAAHNVALVGGDLEDGEKSPPLVRTADFGYLRLRRLDYEPSVIRDWAERITTQKWQSVYAYLKHEVLGPMFAEALLATLHGEPMADLTQIRASIAAPKSKPPSAKGSRAPSSKPEGPKSRPTKLPSSKPSKAPSSKPAKTPSSKPPKAPSSKPAKTPSSKPSKAPSSKPAKTPSSKPSKAPPSKPAKTPSVEPAQNPSKAGKGASKPPETRSETPPSKPAKVLAAKQTDKPRKR